MDLEIIPHESLSFPSFLTFHSAILAIQQWHSTF